jgi:hypothetical protein
VKSDVPVVLFDPGLSGMPIVSDVVLATLAGDAVYAWCFKPRASLTGQRKLGAF